MKIKNLLCAAAAASVFAFPSVVSAEVQKAYTLTPVDVKKDTSITLYEFDKTTGTLKKVYNELTLNKTTYGSGSASTTVDVVVPNKKTQTITVNYDVDKNVPQDISSLTETTVEKTLVNLATSTNDGVLKAVGTASAKKEFDKINVDVIGTTNTTLDGSAEGLVSLSNTNVNGLNADFVSNKLISGNSNYIRYISGSVLSLFDSSLENVNSNIIDNTIFLKTSLNGVEINGGFLFNTSTIKEINGSYIGNTILAETETIDKENLTPDSFSRCVYLPIL